MIRKAPLAEAQIALGKQNTCCRYEAGICPVPKSRKISLKSGNWLLSYDQNDFNMAVVCHADDGYRVLNVLFCIKFHQNRMIFSLR